MRDVKKIISERGKFKIPIFFWFGDEEDYFINV
jgi:hypothetical protein